VDVRGSRFVHVPSDKPTPNKLFIIISSDKDLCGGIRSAVSQATHRALNDAKDSPLVSASANDSTVDPDAPSIVVIGDKSKAQLHRALGDQFQMTFNQIGRDIPTFADAAAVVIKSGIKYDSVVIVYNKFVSANSYEPAVLEVKGEVQWLSVENSMLSRIASSAFSIVVVSLWTSETG